MCIFELRPSIINIFPIKECISVFVVSGNTRTPQGNVPEINRFFISFKLPFSKIIINIVADMLAITHKIYRSPDSEDVVTKPDLVLST